MPGFLRSLLFGKRDGLRSPENLRAVLQQPDGEVHLVDVRTPGEYASGHIPGAANIPYDELGDNPPTSVKDAKIVVYCRSGSRSGTARSILKRNGYTDVTDFGAIRSWPYETTTGIDP